MPEAGETLLLPQAWPTGPGLYVHVPFCATTCGFCAFYQGRPRSADFARFVEAAVREIHLWPFAEPPRTVFWGGGTPGLLPPKHIRALGEAIRSLGLPQGAEWTVELSPATVTPAKLEALLEVGVTRASLGVQSFDEELLRRLERDHAPVQSRRAFAMLRQAGFAQVNVDMMFALPGQTLEAWREELAQALALGPEHLSTYCLTFEEDTSLWVKLARGEHKLDVEREALFYQETAGYVEAGGLRQYEVSNYARRGCACEHNLNTWRMGTWFGVGPSAASQLPQQRRTHPPDLDRWARAVLEGREDFVDVVPLDDAVLAVDALVFGLRLTGGVDVGTLRQRFPAWRESARLEVLWQELESEGLLRRTGGEGLALTAAGRLLADAIGVRVLECA